MKKKKKKKKSIAIKIYAKIPSLLASILGQTMAFARSTQIDLGISVLLLHFQ